MQNHTFPHMMYGTAWKEEQTEALTLLAIESGFRAIDTANQRKHYDEAQVGNAIKKAVDQGLVTRDELFIQTKFTYKEGQDKRLPFDPSASPAEQVEQSFASSLEHLQVENIDSYLLHGPSSHRGLEDRDWQVWQAIEALHKSGKVKHIGVSNMSHKQLKTLLESCEIKPTFIQNRCYAEKNWDEETREVCHQNDVTYQGFSLLTANIPYVNGSLLGRIARRYRCHVPQLIFAFTRHKEMMALTGTTNPRHMKMDLESTTIEIQFDDLYDIEHVSEF